MPNEELMVWYCKDFATRLGYDIDPERATYSICKFIQYLDYDTLEWSVIANMYFNLFFYL